MEKPNAKFSTFVQLMVLVVFPNTASCAPTEPFSTRTTSSVTGGLTLTVLKLKAFSLSMMTLLLNVLKLMPLLMLQVLMLPLLMLIMTLPPLLNMVLPKKFVLLGRDHSTAGTAEDRRVRSNLPSHLSRPCCISSQCNVTTSAILSSLSSLRIVFHFLGCFIHFTVIFIVTYD